MRSGADAITPEVGYTFDYDRVVGLLFLIVAAEIERFEPCSEVFDESVEVGSSGMHSYSRSAWRHFVEYKVRNCRTKSESATAIMDRMTIQRMEHVGIVVDDLAAAIEFFIDLGLELQGEVPVEGRWVDRVVGLDGVRADIAMLGTPDGHGRLELTKYHTPSIPVDNRHATANTPGIRHVAFLVEDIDAVVAGLRARGNKLVGELERYEDSYRLCYVRGPEGIIVELAERIG